MQRKFEVFPQNPFDILSNESLKFHAAKLAWQKLDELADELGRFNRHLERCEVELICDAIASDATQL